MEISGNTVNVVLGALLALSEILSLTPLKSNGIFQLVMNVLRGLNFSGSGGRGPEKEEMTP